MVIVSAPTVVALASTASPSDRISSNRLLSAAEEKSEGVWLRVEILPSQVRAKLATTNGLSGAGAPPAVDWLLEPMGGAGGRVGWPEGQSWRV